MLAFHVELIRRAENENLQSCSPFWNKDGIDRASVVKTRPSPSIDPREEVIDHQKRQG
jgi:hypothetical protein